MWSTLGQAVFFCGFVAFAATSAEDARLDALLEALADPQAREVDRLHSEIDALWAESGSASMNLLLRRGRAAMESETYPKALDHLNALTRLAPDFAEGWNARATTHFLAEDYWASVADIQRVLALEPRHFGALAGLGFILERTGDKAGALRAFRAALALNPHLDEAADAAARLETEVDGRRI